MVHPDFEYARRVFFFPIALLLAFLIGLPSASLGATLPELRLSGVMMVAGKPTVAILVLPDGRQQTVRQGAKIPAVGEVVKIAQDRIVIRTKEGDKEIVVDAGEPSKQSAQPGKVQPSTAGGTAPPRGVVAVDDNITAVIDKFARDPAAKIQDVGFALRPLLGLPANAEITLMKGMSFEPVESVADFKQQLNQGQMTTVKINGVEGREMLYLEPPNHGKITPAP